MLPKFSAATAAFLAALLALNGAAGQDVQANWWGCPTRTITRTVTVTNQPSASQSPPSTHTTSIAPTTTSKPSVTSSTSQVSSATLSEPSSSSGATSSVGTTSASPPISTTAPGTWAGPKIGDTFLWSIGREIPPDPQDGRNRSLNQNWYGIDLDDSPDTLIAQYHEIGKRVSCYFSAGTWEKWRTDAGRFTPACYCNATASCALPDWEEEYWLDLSSPACVANVEDVMGNRLAMAKSKGCDAVEPDNLDSYDNKPGFNTTEGQQYNYLVWLATAAHEAGLAIALKNDGDLLEKHADLADMFDFAIVEECERYKECEKYEPFVKADPPKPVFGAEYKRSITCDRPGFDFASYSSENVEYQNIVDTCVGPAPA